MTDLELAKEAILGLMPSGRDNAISASWLAAEVGISERMVGALVAELIESEGYCIGSLCGVGAGYFQIRPGNVEDLEAGVGHTVRRGAAIFRRVRALRRSWEASAGGAQTRLFEASMEGDRA